MAKVKIVSKVGECSFCGRSNRQVAKKKGLELWGCVRDTEGCFGLMLRRDQAKAVPCAS